MSEFMGTDNMIALQKALQARGAEFAENPLTSNGGRIMNIHEPDEFGWTKVRAAAERDGIVALTMVDKDQTLSRLASMFGDDIDFPYWQAFTGSPDDVLHSCADVIAGFALPEGWTIESHTNPDDETIHASQLLNTATGVAPAPAYYLRGESLPSMLTCVHNASGELAACASATMRYRPDGPLAGWLFAGGVSVNTEHRRSGLGSYVNATLLSDSHKALNWVNTLEQAKADNPASVGMISRCGLRESAEKITVIINLTGGYITR